jgi:tetratricopeptide (TPR) repeat protein
MSPEQEKLNEIFSEALDRASPQERQSYLDFACRADPELRKHVEVLLVAHCEAGDFLKQTIIQRDTRPVGEGPGSLIGRYTLLQQIGEGGFGVVFMAEQQEPVHRMVALKILKPGMDTREVIARFEAERQALALMDHPNIAHVLDGGVAASGRPYFVMDLVKGVPITDFCDKRNLTTEQRLNLFLQVCAGVQHAHQKGVIHRDLKPANILVTLHEGEPVPKVIDFGVAKAIGQKLTERTLFTRFEQLIGTPAYMSPEQAEWSGLGVDTRTDIYALGVLLYELLTGTTPLEKETLARAALDEVRRLIRETEPPTPSTRLLALGGRAAEIARQRQTEPALLARQVRGELDWIVVKTIEKDRNRRYETVNALARDLERHLSGEPVAACPPSAGYRARKFIRRHRVGATIVSAVTVSLVAGLMLAVLGWVQARRATKRAQEEAANADAVKDFLTEDLLAQASPEFTTNRNLTARELLDRASGKIRDRFTNQPLVEASIRYTLGDTYRFLGEFSLAEQHIRRAVEIRTEKLGSDDPATVKALSELALLYAQLGRDAEAAPIYRKVVDSDSRIYGPNDVRTLKAFGMLALSFAGSGHVVEGEEMFRDVLEKERRLLGPEHWLTHQSMDFLARIYLDSDQPSEAADLEEEVFRCERSDPGWHTAQVEFTLADSHFRLGDYERAAKLSTEAFELYRSRYGSASSAQCLQLLADAYGAMGCWSNCVAFCRDITQWTNDLAASSHYGLCGAVAALLAGDTNAYCEFARRELAEFEITTNADWARVVAETCLLRPASVPDQESVLKLAERGAHNLPDRRWGQLAQGIAEYRCGRFAEALTTLERLRQTALPFAASQAGYLCAMIHYRQGNPAIAKAEMEEAAKHLESFVRSGKLGDSWHEYGRVAIIRAEAECLILGHEISPILGAQWFEQAREQWTPVRRHLNEADRLAGRGKWTDARDEYLAAIEEPEFDWETADSCHWNLANKIGFTFLRAKDRTAHEQLCRRLFARLDHFPDGDLAATVAKMYLASGLCLTNDLGRKALHAAETMKDDPGNFPPEFLDVVTVMAAYRTGRYHEAIDRAKNIETANGLALSNEARLYHAMGLARLGRVEEGKKELAQAEKNLGKSLARLTGDYWWELARCQLALDEAHRLFGETAKK